MEIFLVYFNRKSSRNIYEQFSFQQRTSCLSLRIARPYKNADERLFFQQYGNRLQRKMFAFFFELMAHLSLERLPKTNSVRTEISDYIEKIKNLIFVNYSNPDFKIEDLSFMINLSHSYLCSIFKKSTNISLKKYLSDIRMEQALDLL